MLQNMNRLNRNLESIVAVGNEFAAVEALWSQFENFMGRDEEQQQQQQAQEESSATAAATGTGAATSGRGSAATSSNSR